MSSESCLKNKSVMVPVISDNIESATEIPAMPHICSHNFASSLCKTVLSPAGRFKVVTLTKMEPGI